MQIYNKNINSIMTTKANGVYLIFGPEEESVVYTMEVLKKNFKVSNPGYETIYLEYNELKSDEFLLKNYINTNSLFSSNKVIIINNCTTSCLECIKNTKLSSQKDLILFIAGDLGKTSSLRLFFENHPSYYAVACYKLDMYSLKQSINKIVNALGLILTNDVMNAFLAIMPNDILIIRQELIKLSIYKDRDKNVNAHDIELLYQNSSDFHLDNLCSAIIQGDYNMMAQCLLQIEYYNVNFMLIIRSILHLFRKIQIVSREIVCNNLSAEDAVGKLRPKVFFKQRDNIIMAARKWQNQQIEKIIHELLELEVQTKSIGINPSLLLRYRLINIVL